MEVQQLLLAGRSTSRLVGVNLIFYIELKNLFIYILMNNGEAIVIIILNTCYVNIVEKDRCCFTSRVGNKSL